MPPEVTISILAYENLALTKNCLESVFAAGGDFELILTNNGSKDGTASYFDALTRAKPRVRAIHNPKNEGFIAPNRKAFAMAKGKFFVLLNNDTVVAKNWLDLLKIPFQTDPKCALSGPANGCCQLTSTFHGEQGPRLDYLEGSLLCMDRDKVRSVEPNLFPNELVGAYGEDSYLSLRMREAGFTIHRVALTYTHYRGATTAMVPQAKEWEEHNHKFLQARFRRYMMGRSFAYPTIVKRAAAYGDVLLTTPILRALKRIRPCSPIWVETSCPEVFNGNPDVATVSRLPLPQPEAHILINLNGISEMRPHLPILQAYAECAEVELEGETTVMYPCQGDIEWARRVVPGREWIGMHLGPTSWPCKNWPYDRWKVVIDALRGRGNKVVLVGNDRAPMMPSDLDLRGQTNIGQLASLLGQCALFVGLDSFPLHVAQAMKTPVVGLFGITTAANILTDGSPWIACESATDHPGTGLRHRVVGQTRVDHPDNPMNTIPPSAVLNAIERQLATAVL